jgi:hypothetical protein
VLSWLLGKRESFLIGEDGKEGIDEKESLLFLFGRWVLSARLFNLAADRSCRAFLEVRTARCTFRDRGVKNLLKRRGVTEGFFFIRLLRRGLICSSAAMAKVTVSACEDLSGVRSMATDVTVEYRYSMLWTYQFDRSITPPIDPLPTD